MNEDIGVQRRAICAVSACAVVAATFLPWRSVRGAGSDGWRTAQLALSLANTFGDKRLQLAAFVFFLVPIGALGAMWFLLLVPTSLGIVAARTLSALTLIVSAASAFAAASQPSIHIAPEGPALSVVAASVLGVSCWGLSLRGKRPPRTPGDLP